ncbi:succinyl-CoA ligase subunit alpha [Mycena crocata]|nr:succinyl-CoA ligase subunit alpha [Mycena crocata]
MSPKGLIPCTRAQFSTSCSRSIDNDLYAATRKNLKIGSHTRVILQGFTGRLATATAIESLAWGTNIVGGVTPGRTGFHPVLKDLPVFPTVKKAVKELKPDATGIYVAAPHAAAAIEEAIEAEIPLIVAVAEHIPVHNMLRIHSMLRSQSKSRLVGANAPGIISPLGRCRIGFQPLPAFSPGHVGIVAKSGTLSYETVAALTRAGLGQSLCIGMGGDMVAGTDFVDALEVFKDDPDTHGIIVVGEIGGRAEEEAAEWIAKYRRHTEQPKPIAALVAGILAPHGRVMGHAGAWAGLGERSAGEKYNALRNAGAVMVDHPAQFGEVMARLLKQQSSSSSAAKSSQERGRRQYHTLLNPGFSPLRAPSLCHEQRRTLHLHSSQAADLLLQHGIRTTPVTDIHNTEHRHLVSVTIDRSARRPCILTQSLADTTNLHTKRVAFDIGDASDSATQDVFASVHQNLGLQGTSYSSLSTPVNALLLALKNIFMAYEGINIQVTTDLDLADPDAPMLIVSDPQFTFDDAAFRSCGRHAELHALRDISPAAVDPAELSAEADGIVYVKLGPTDPLHPENLEAPRNIGTLVNGAGLALNTVDALALPPYHGRATNFLDTGGKATAETVKRGFELLLEDPRVKVIFLNVFGGLTLGDMIAKGVLLAFRELGLMERGVPVVVRIRGTNEEEGQRIIAESGLSVFAFAGFVKDQGTFMQSMCKHPISAAAATQRNKHSAGECVLEGCRNPRRRWFN